MRATKLRDAEAFYEVHNGERWYTVSMNPPSGPAIMNEQLRPVNQTSALGKRIMKAVSERQSMED